MAYVRAWGPAVTAVQVVLVILEAGGAIAVAFLFGVMWARNRDKDKDE